MSFLDLSSITNLLISLATLFILLSSRKDKQEALPVESEIKTFDKVILGKKKVPKYHDEGWELEKEKRPT